MHYTNTTIPVTIIFASFITYLSFLDLPPPILIPSKSNNSGCVNLTINQPYFMSVDLSYNITLTCFNESDMVSTSNNVSSNFSVEVCYDSVNGVQHSNFECTVSVTVSR